MPVKTHPRYQLDEASLQNHGQSWEFYDAYGFRLYALDVGEQLHVSMLHAPFGSRQLTGVNSQRDV